MRRKDQQFHSSGCGDRTTDGVVGWVVGGRKIFGGVFNAKED